MTENEYADRMREATSDAERNGAKALGDYARTNGWCEEELAPAADMPPGFIATCMACPAQVEGFMLDTDGALWAIYGRERHAGWSVCMAGPVPLEGADRGALMDRAVGGEVPVLPRENCRDRQSPTHLAHLAYGAARAALVARAVIREGLDHG